MCGIVGFTGKENAAPVLFAGLYKLEYRGYDSSGIATVSDGGIFMLKTKGRVADLEKKAAGGDFLPGKVGIGHTRWATHGAPSDKNAHPMLSYDGNFAVVHNGIIENFSALKADLIKSGVAFSSETDTETVAHLIAREYADCRDVMLAVSRATALLRGSFALGIITPLFPDSIFAVRKDSPLVIGVGEGFNMIASDIPALMNKTDKVILPNEGNIVRLNTNSVHIYDSGLNEVHPDYVYFDNNETGADQDGFPHYMLKEIYQQPEAVKRVFEKTEEFCALNGFIAEKFASRPKKIDVVGCGSAYHAALLGKYFIEKTALIPVEAHTAGEYRYRDAITDSETLTVIISQSGETADSLAALREARRKGSPVMCIVNARFSSIARESDFVFFTEAGPEIAVATTKGYSTQIAALFRLGVILCRDDAVKAYYEKDFSTLAEKMQTAIRLSERVFGVAKYVASREHAYFIGRLADYATACEGALKLKEISYIHAEAYAAAELKHGTISLIGEGVPVIALSTCDELESKMLAGVKEVKTRGGVIFTITDSDSPEWDEVSNVVIRIPRSDSLTCGIIAVPVLQLLGYYAAELRGCDIDKPRNLAKSVTVE